MDRITGEIADYRVGPVEVGLYDSTDTGASGLFMGLFISVGHAATTATVNQFDVPTRALIPVEQSRQAMCQCLIPRQRPNTITGEPAPLPVNQ